MPDEAHHETWQTLMDWRVVAIPHQPSGMMYQVLFGGETAEDLADIKTWTAEGLGLIIESLPQSLIGSPGMVFELQVQSRSGAKDWQTVSTLRPLHQDQRFNLSEAFRGLDQLVDSGWVAGLDPREFSRDVRAARRELVEMAREGFPGQLTRRTFSHI